MINPKDIHHIEYFVNEKIIKYKAENGYVLFQKYSNFKDASETVKKWLEYKKAQTKGTH